MKSKYPLPNCRIAVVGAGAVGGYYGAKLAHHGRDVHFLMRGDLRERRRAGLRVQGSGEDFWVAPLQCYNTTEEIGPCDLVLIAVKATSNADLLQLVPPLLHDRTVLLTLQNGLGNEEFLAENFGAERVIGGLCFVCLNRTAPGVIEHYDHGRVVLGEYGGRALPRTHAICSEFQRCGVVCSVAENLPLERWRKLVWNVPFNGLALTAGGVDTAVILGDEQLRATALALMEEVIAAANQRGYPLPAAVALEQLKRTDMMGAYKPSTLIDFEAGRPLEIEAIWGEPMRRAQAAGCAVPQLAALYEQLKEIARVRLTRA
ncbi:putative 2-dehydropantoate 2-reductase [soil metagenome]